MLVIKRMTTFKAAQSIKNIEDAIKKSFTKLIKTFIQR